MVPFRAALRGPLRCGRTTRESATNSRLHLSVHDPRIIRDSADLAAGSLRRPSPLLLASRRVCGCWISSPAKGKVNLWGGDDPPPPPPPSRLPCHSSDVTKFNCGHCGTHCVTYSICSTITSLPNLLHYISSFTKSVFTQILNRS